MFVEKYYLIRDGCSIYNLWKIRQKLMDVWRIINGSTNYHFFVQVSRANELWWSNVVKSDFANRENVWLIWNPDFLMVRFQIVWFSNVRALPIHHLYHSKSGHFCLHFKWFLTKWWPFVWISNGWASRFQTPFQIGPCSTQTLFDHSKFRLVWISDPHCFLLITFRRSRVLTQNLSTRRIPKFCDLSWVKF